MRRVNFAPVLDWLPKIESDQVQVVDWAHYWSVHDWSQRRLEEQGWFDEVHSSTDNEEPFENEAFFLLQSRGIFRKVLVCLPEAEVAQVTAVDKITNRVVKNSLWRSRN